LLRKRKEEKKKASGQQPLRGANSKNNWCKTHPGPEENEKTHTNHPDVGIGKRWRRVLQICVCVPESQSEIRTLCTPSDSQRVICSFIARGKSPFDEDRQKGPTACQRSPYSLASAGLEDLCKHRRTQMLSSDGGITGITISHLMADLQTPSSENIFSRRDSKWRHPMCKNSTGVRAYVLKYMLCAKLQAGAKLHARAGCSKLNCILELNCMLG
jgi:hypothetical protein